VELQSCIIMSSVQILEYNFLVVLYGCETWSLTLREEYRLKVSENRVFRRIFGQKRRGNEGVEKTA
jgi:hypothetical protein